MKQYWNKIACLLAFSISANCLEFENSLKKADPGHDKITDLAYQCVLKYKGKEPVDCLGLIDFPINRGIDSDSYLNHAPFDKQMFMPFTVDELIKGTIWPDDPTRQINFKTFLKPAYNFIRKCKKLKYNIRGGLFCNSHLMGIKELIFTRVKP